MLHIPGCRIELVGNKDAAQTKIHEAFAYYTICRDIVYASVDIWKAQKVFNSWAVDIQVHNDNARIVITYPAFGGLKQAIPRVIQKCFCGRHFSFGIILARKIYGETEYTDTEPPAESVLCTNRCAYIVAVCVGEVYYEVVEDVLDSNFGIYFIGQFVLVTFYEEMVDWDNPVDCDRACLMDTPRFETLAISPLSVESSMMQQWIREDIDYSQG